MPQILHKSIATALVCMIFENSIHPASATSEFLVYANILAQRGIISMKKTETEYRLGALVTRAEVAKIAVRLGEKNVAGCSGDIYADVDSSLGDLCGYVETAATSGIVSRTYPEFRSAAPITRAELTKMLVVASGISTSLLSAGFSDASQGAIGELALYVNA